jgi:predicted nucleic acid-binding protein
MKQQQFISEARDEITRLHGRLRRLGASLADFRSWRAQQKTNEKMQLVHRN